MRKFTIINLPSDGFGSLIEYILGALFFSHKYGLEYVHTNLKTVEHNNGVSNDIWLSICNESIQKIFLPDVKNSVEFKGSIQDVDNLFLPNTDENTLFRLTNNSFLKYIFDQEQNQNKLLKELIINNFVNKTKSEIKDFKSRAINIAVHIRKFMKTDIDPSSWRECYEKGNDVDIFFQNIITNLLRIFPNAFVHIYSQEERDVFNHFLDISPNIYVYTDNNLMHDIIHLSHADILIMSKGSYSRIANFYSSGVKIIREKSEPVLSDKTLYISSSGNLTNEQESFILTNCSII